MTITNIFTLWIPACAGDEVVPIDPVFTFTFVIPVETGIQNISGSRLRVRRIASNRSRVHLYFRHSREDGNPEHFRTACAGMTITSIFTLWIPAYAGMTITNIFTLWIPACAGDEVVPIDPVFTFTFVIPVKTGIQNISGPPARG